MTEAGERCHAEIAWREARLRSGDPFEMEGVLQGLQDWSAELRELESLPAAACVPLALQKPLCIELFAGLHGWGAGFAAEGYRVVGFDIVDMGKVCGQRPPDGCQLVIQDVLTIHGSQFRDAAVIVASPPCQNYSYLAMPWSRSTNPNNSLKAKAMRKKWETEGPDNRLFDACFRIQREACEAAGRFIPLIVENVRGAIPWVGRSAWNYGSFHLWGDVPALMPFSGKLLKGKTNFHFHEKTGLPSPSWHGAEHESSVARAMEMQGGIKQLHSRGDNQTCGKHRMGLGAETLPAGQKVPAYSDPQRNGGKGVHLTSPHENAEGLKTIESDAVKQSMGRGDWFSKEARDGGASARFSSKSNARRMASAMIAKIPLPLAQHIASVYKPRLPVLQGDRLGAAAGKSECLMADAGGESQR